MTRFRTAAVFAAAVAACGLAGPSPAQKPAPKVEPVLPARQVLVKGLRDAVKNDDEKPFIRLLMATALIKAAPDDEDAAKVLVAALVEGELAADAYQSIEEVIPAAPPALIRALVPVLKDRKDINRQRAAALLAKIDPKNLP
jgi:hypothetical protein